MRVLLAALLVCLVLAACQAPSSTENGDGDANATPDVSTSEPEPTSDVDATVAAMVESTVAAIPTDLPESTTAPLSPDPTDLPVSDPFPL